MSFFFESLKFICFFSKNINPDVGLSIKDNKFNNVDLPDPDGPIKA